MNIKTMLTGTALALAVGAQGFTFEDIHYWIGTGTNRCALVMDWSGMYGSESEFGAPTARAWGFRWNGEAPKLDKILEQVVAEDPRLRLGGSDSGWGFYLEFLGYDTADANASFDVASETASEPSALIGSGTCGLWWNVMSAVNGDEYLNTKENLTMPSVGLSSITPARGDWWVLYYGMSDYDPETWEMFPVADCEEPAAAESPYGWRIVDAYTEDESTLWGDMSGEPAYTNRAAVLGRPRDVMVEADGYSLINPYNSEWQKNQLFALSCLDGDEALAFVTIEFDHPVVDDPRNPFGVDFIVFGNTFATGNDDSWYYDGVDPEALVFSGAGDSADEQGLVEVSADGEEWFEIEGRYADSSMPTLGRVFDRVHPDTSLFAGNAHWGARTNPLFPVDPRVSIADCAGLTLGEVCRRYNGSAGGTGFDISGLDLPTDANGRKWFKYVRISSKETGKLDADGYPIWSEVEVDAVADVAPVSAYQNWVCDNFSWADAYKNEAYTNEVYAGEAYAQNLTGFSALSANGKPNGVNAILGQSPTEAAAALDFRIEGFTINESYVDFMVMASRSLADSVGHFRAGGKKSLNTKRWSYEPPAFVEAARDAESGLWINVLRRSLDDEPKFFKLELRP